MKKCLIGFSLVWSLIAVAATEYTGTSFVDDVKGTKTGFFHVEQINDKGVQRWWIVDPLGRGFVLQGIDHVKYDGFRDGETKKWPHREANKKLFPNVLDWETNAVSRLKQWGFNVMAGGPGQIKNNHSNSFVNAWGLKMGLRLCWADKVDKDLWITPSNEYGHCSAFPNVFNPDFAAHCDAVAKANCPRHRGNPWMFGYFLDNELAWWGIKSKPRDPTGLFEAAMNLEETHTAKIALRKFLKDRGVTGEAGYDDKIAFLELIAEKYFSITTAAVRKYDPDHMILGVRFAGLAGAPHEVIWKVAGKYCDIVSFNSYPWADIDKGVVYINNLKGAPTVAEAFAKRYGWAQKPLIVTEWSFPALDSGLPCMGGAGQRFYTQQQRAIATELFVKTMWSLPFMVGSDYFMWVDPDTNYGLINQRGEAYKEVTDVFARLNKEAGKWRRAEAPKEKSVVPVTAADIKGKIGANGDVVFTRNGDEWTLKNSAGLVLKGRLGGSNVFERVEYKGKFLGWHNARVQVKTGKTSKKSSEISKVTDVAFEKSNGLGTLFVTGEGAVDANKFRVTIAVSVFGNKPQWMHELVKIENRGKASFEVTKVLFRNYTSYENARHRWKIGYSEIEKLWTNPRCDYWVIPDGDMFYGALSRAAAASDCRYHVSKYKTVHPDMQFEFGENPVVKGGETFEIKDGGVWMLSLCGEGGIKGWKELLFSFAE